MLAPEAQENDVKNSESCPSRLRVVVARVDAPAAEDAGKIAKVLDGDGTSAKVRRYLCGGRK